MGKRSPTSLRRDPAPPLRASAAEEEAARRGEVGKGSARSNLNLVRNYREAKTERHQLSSLPPPNLRSAVTSADLWVSFLGPEHYKDKYIRGLRVFFILFLFVWGWFWFVFFKRKGVSTQPHASPASGSAASFRSLSSSCGTKS